jgi:hypothetical protein
MKRSRLPTWLFAGKLTFTAAFALSLAVWASIIQRLARD